MWSPHNQDAFTTAMVDGSIRLWDTRQSSFSSSIMAHTGEALTADYDK
jgi:WD40 repeat protein